MKISDIEAAVAQSPFAIKEKQSSWQMRFADVVYRPPVGKEPNWFHRLMQRLVFGFRWERVPEQERA